MGFPSNRPSNIWPLQPGQDFLQLQGEGGNVLGGIDANGYPAGNMTGQPISGTSAVGGSVSNPMLSGSSTNNHFCTAQNQVMIQPIIFNYPVTIRSIYIHMTNGSGANLCDWGFYNASGKLVANVGAQATVSATNPGSTITQSSATLTPGFYIFATTSNESSPASLYVGAGVARWMFPWTTATSTTASSGGALPSVISIPAPQPTWLTSQPTDVGPAVFLLA